MGKRVTFYGIKGWEWEELLHVEKEEIRGFLEREIRIRVVEMKWNKRNEKRGE